MTLVKPECQAALFMTPFIKWSLIVTGSAMLTFSSSSFDQMWFVWRQAWSAAYNLRELRLRDLRGSVGAARLRSAHARWPCRRAAGHRSYRRSSTGGLAWSRVSTAGSMRAVVLRTIACAAAAESMGQRRLLVYNACSCAGNAC